MTGIMQKIILYLLKKVSLLKIFRTRVRVSDKVLRDAHIAVENGALILDVRTQEEYKVKHVKNAVNIPVQQLNKKYKDIPEDKEIVIYCRKGNRSQGAAKYLQERGRKVYDVATQKEWERKIPRHHYH